MRYIGCIVLLLFGAAVSALPRLIPVTDRALRPGHIFSYSAGGSGYPAIQSNMPLLHGLIDGTRLDDRCRLTGVRDVPIGNPLVSFTRLYIGWSGIPEGDGLVRYGPDNRRTLASPSPVGKRWLTSLGDDGSFFDDRGMAYDAHGRLLPLPTTADGQPLRVVGWLCTDDVRYRLLQAGKDVFLCDAGMPWLYPARVNERMGTQGFALLHDRDRVAIVPETGSPAVLLLEGKEMERIGVASTYWRCGEDGSLWRNADGRLTIFSWRNGRPREVPFPVRAAPNRWYRDDAFDNRPGWAAVWHDGELVAVTAMAAPWTRRLTLYRKGKPLRQCDVQITDFFKGKGGINREHLAFTRDGRYLSWIVDTGSRTRVLAFRVR